MAEAALSVAKGAADSVSLNSWRDLLGVDEYAAQRLERVERVAHSIPAGSV